MRPLPQRTEAAPRPKATTALPQPTVLRDHRSAAASPAVRPWQQLERPKKTSSICCCCLVLDPPQRACRISSLHEELHRWLPDCALRRPRQRRQVREKTHKNAGCVVPILPRRQDWLPIPTPLLHARWALGREPAHIPLSPAKADASRTQGKSTPKTLGGTPSTKASHRLLASPPSCPGVPLVRCRPVRRVGRECQPQRLRHRRHDRPCGPGKRVRDKKRDDEVAVKCAEETSHHRNRRSEHVSAQSDAGCGQAASPPLSARR